MKQFYPGLQQSTFFLTDSQARAGGGVNANGARGKMGTIKKAVKDIGASVWFMQETKCTREGSIQLDGFITYEHLRANGEGGGIALSAMKDLISNSP